MPNWSESHSEHHGHGLQLIPYEIINLASGNIAQPPYANKTLLDNQILKGESFVDINPVTASKYGLSQGDRIAISSGKGKETVLVNLFNGAMPGMVYMPMGFGHTAYDAFAQGQGASPNNLIEDKQDPLTGLPVWWNTSVIITKV